MLKKVKLISIFIVALSLVFSVPVFSESWKDNEELEFGYYYNLDDYEEITGDKIQDLNESPMLEEKVEAGELPPVEERLPQNPLVQLPWEEIGKYGGTLRTADYRINVDHSMRHINDSKMCNFPTDDMSHHHAGPYTPRVPDILENWDVSEDYKVHTFTIRKGLKWSDGEPVTTEDVKYQIEDVLMNKEITPVTPTWMRWPDYGSEITTELEVVDKYTFRFIFEEPFPAFEMQTILSVAPPFWSHYIRPKHYEKKYHKKYTDWDKLLPLMEKEEFREKDEWGEFYESMFGTRPSGPFIISSIISKDKEYPTLDPYVAVKSTEEGDWTFERNPYFHMIDPEGNQLPYIDRVKREYVSNTDMIKMNIISGKIDLQIYDLKSEDYPLYKKNEVKGGYNVNMAKPWQHHMLIYFLNMAHEDPEIRAVTQELDFRKALSLALDRNHMKEAVFMGFGEPAQFTAPSDSKYYVEGTEDLYADYDPEQAKKILDEMGMVDVNGDGWRETPEGNEFVLPIEFYEVTPTAVPGAELAERYWKDIGINVQTKQVNNQYWWSLKNANKHIVGIWWADGFNPGTTSMIGQDVPTPAWRDWMETEGEEGYEPKPWYKELYKAQKTFYQSPDDEERLKAGRKIIRLNAENLGQIGTVAAPKTPVVYSKQLGNIEIGFEKDVINTNFSDAATQFFFKE